MLSPLPPPADTLSPKGCIELLDRAGVKIAGRRAVVVGRSNIVGMPAALLLLRRDATVTVVHSRTEDPAAVIREADIVIAAAGKAVRGGVKDRRYDFFPGSVAGGRGGGGGPSTRVDGLLRAAAAAAAAVSSELPLQHF